ncbi:MAG: hypothetical protein Q9Q40_11795 [Acidobacteriota bacterium]|nr:hypothetical protein [Acidobacteriota bacterium]
MGRRTVLLLLAGVVGSALAGGEAVGRSERIDGEARRLIAALTRLWPDVSCRLDEPGPAPLPPGSLLARAVRGGSADRLEVAIAARVAAAWRRCLGDALPAPPTFEDAEPPAPEAWVKKALPGLVAREAGFLARALEASGASDSRRLAARAAAARFRRVAMLSPAAIARRRLAERQQGLALYTAYHALLRARHESPAAGGGDFAYTLAPALRSVLLEALEQAAGGESAAFTPEVAGFAQALVLDRVRHGWREELHDAWRSLDQLLVQPVRPFGDRGAAPAAR